MITDHMLHPITCGNCGRTVPGRTRAYPHSRTTENRGICERCIRGAPKDVPLVFGTWQPDLTPLCPNANRAGRMRWLEEGAMAIPPYCSCSRAVGYRELFEEAS